MTTSAYVLNSHGWLFAQLRAPASDHNEFEWAPSPDVADVVVYLVPEWPDKEAPESLAKVPFRSWWRRLYLFSATDAPIPWAPGVFASLERRWAVNGGFRGGFYVPHHHREPGGL